MPLWVGRDKLFVLCALGISGLVQAGELSNAYEKAKQIEPLFQASLAELEGNKINVSVARSAYFPELRVTSSRAEIETSTRSTVTVAQPIFSLDRWAVFRQAGPRETLAQATFKVRETELGQRVFKAGAEYVRAKEELNLNRARIDAFEQQAKSAKRAYDLGQGTITDLQDSQVKLDQARAADLSLKAGLDAAMRQFLSMTGYRPNQTAFELVKAKRNIVLKTVKAYLDDANLDNPQIVTARQNEEIGDLEVLKAKSALFPSVLATATRTEANNIAVSYLGLQLQFPLQAGGVMQIYASRANAEKLKAQTHDAELKTELEIQRLHSLVEAGLSEVAIRLDAIRSAELSVVANEKSFSGGVRSKVDVLNALQVKFQTQQDYIISMLTLAENYLNLQLQAAVPVSEALHGVDSLIF